MHYKFDTMEPTTEFGKWLYKKMQEHEMNCVDVANRLHITRQIVAFHLNGQQPKFPVVVAYCWLFECDNPEVIWKLVEKDKGI